MNCSQQDMYREEGLRLDSGVHRPGLEVVQEVGQQPQALLRRVVPVEPEAPVGRVVVPLMEGLEPARMPCQPLSEACA